MYNARPRWLMVAFIFALLPACGNSDHTSAPPATTSSTPDKTVLTTVQLLKDGQFDPLLKHLLPPAEYWKMRNEWTIQHAKIKQISNKDRHLFAENMAVLTAADANQKIWTRVQPQLQQLNKKYKTQLPMMIGVGQLMLSTQISNSKQLTAQQKKHARDVVTALGQWAQQAQWTHPDKVKQIISVATASARKLDIKTLDQANMLSYDQFMNKYGILWSGVKQALDIYGLSIDKILGSAKARILSSDTHSATVKLDYSLLDKPLTLTLTLVKINDRWYDKDLLDHWHEKLATPPPAAASAAITAKPSSAASATKPPSAASRGK